MWSSASIQRARTMFALPRYTIILAKMSVDEILDLTVDVLSFYNNNEAR